MYWDLSVIALCLLLMIFLLWKEFKRPNKTWLTSRIIASLLSVISLACLALPLTIKHTVNSTSSVSPILITVGYDNDSLQKILNNNNKTAKVYTTDKKINYFKATYIPDVTSITVKNSTPIDIVGYGLNEGELMLLKNKPIAFHPSDIKSAISSVSWTQKLTSGDPLVVQGSFSNANSLPAKIILSGFNTNLDSVTVAPNKTSYFQLTTTPKLLYKAVYNITVLLGKDTIETEPVPVEVIPAQPLSILMLAASPDFENKFLKNWLSTNEYKFAVRTTITNNKYDEEYINISRVSLDRITPSLLEKFDVIIADASALKSLPASDIATIKSYVESKGVGLIVKADTLINSSAFYSKSFPLSEARDSTQHAVKLYLNDTSLTAPLKIEQSIYIKVEAGTQPLIKDQQMRIVVNSKMQGRGKVLLATISNTYSWQLMGNNKDYSSYWSLLLTKASKKIPLDEVWNVSPSIPRINEEVHLKLQTAKSDTPKVQAGADVMPMEQNYLLPYEWNGTYWPTKSGWQPLMNNQGSSVWWYVYDNKDWKGIEAMDKIRATRKYERDHPFTNAKPLITSIEADTEIPKIYFFILFIICAGLLWFEKKFNNE